MSCWNTWCQWTFCIFTVGLKLLTNPYAKQLHTCMEKARLIFLHVQSQRLHHVWGSLPSSGVTGELALNSDFWACPNKSQRKPRQCKAYCCGWDASPPTHGWATLYSVGWDHPTLPCQSCTGILTPWFVAQQSKGQGEDFYKLVLDHVCVWRLFWFF